MRKSTFLLFFLVLSLLYLNCGDPDELHPKDIVMEGPSISFTVEHGTGSDIMFSESTNPIVINKGESVVFKNTSTYQIEYFDGTSETIDISNVSNWKFDGGHIAISQQNIETVTYTTPGKYHVILRSEYDGVEYGFNFLFYVEVIDDEPEPESVCVIGKEESSDGLETEFCHKFLLDTMLVIKGADKRANGELKEYSLFVYDADNKLKTEEFYTPSNNLLGEIKYTRDSKKRIVNQITQDASGLLIQELTFKWDEVNNIIKSAKGEFATGPGVSYSADIVYGYDEDMENVTEEIATKDGAQLWRIEYEYDDKVHLFSGFEIQKFPERGNTNNLTSVLTYNQNNDLVDTRISSYTYEGDGESPCIDRPVSEERTINGVTTTYNFTHIIY